MSRTVPKRIRVGRLHSPRNVRGFKWVLIVSSILSSTFLFALDQTIIADVQPTIIKRFGEVDKLSWLSVAFSLGAGSTNLVWGKAFSQFQAKWIYILTLLLFEGGSAICGAAKNINTLIIGRALAGVGGAGMYVGATTLLSLFTMEHERPTYIAMAGLTWGSGTMLGPVVGGALTNKLDWRYAFYINLDCCIA